MQFMQIYKTQFKRNKRELYSWRTSSWPRFFSYRFYPRSLARKSLQTLLLSRSSIATIVLKDFRFLNNIRQEGGIWALWNCKEFVNTGTTKNKNWSITFKPCHPPTSSSFQQWEYHSDDQTIRLAAFPDTCIDIDNYGTQASITIEFIHAWSYIDIDR